MTQKLDYSREEAMQILNSENYSDEQKRTLYDQYMAQLKKNRKNAIVEKLNNYARNIPFITKEIYIEKLKEYENDDLSKPFEVIESELSKFETDMNTKYNEYLEKQNKNEEPEEIIPDMISESENDDFENTIFTEQPIVEEANIEDVKPSLLITDEISVLNEATSELSGPLFDNNNEDVKEVLPDLDEKEKGNASAIILSIIAVIIGIVVMYSIIKFN